jgi:hypothetical protein
MRGYRAQTSVECTTIITAGLTVKSGLGSSLHYIGSGWLLVCSRLLVQVCWSVPLSSVGQQPLSFVGNNSCPTEDNNPCPLWATTLVLCGQQPLSSVGQQP